MQTSVPRWLGIFAILSFAGLAVLGLENHWSDGDCVVWFALWVALVLFLAHLANMGTRQEPPA
jgi:quinol-cytochrome oxidoreductase complex cytochrome b subunit